MTTQALISIDNFSLMDFEGFQLFDRYKMGLLWKKRHLFDPGQVAFLKSLWDSKVKGTLKCKTPTIYRLTKDGAGKMGYGRYYGSGGSLEKLERGVRATLCSKFYNDVDIYNCHPDLTWQLSKILFNKDMIMLKYYCENRKALLQQWMEDYNIGEKEAKDIIIICINGGSFERKTKEGRGKHGEILPPVYPESILKNHIIQTIRQEVREFIDQLIESKIHNNLYEWCKKNKDNYRGSFISLIYQSEEAKCLKSIVYTLILHKFIVDVLSYDGCMVRIDKNNPITSEILKKCEEAVEKHTGYKIQLKVKPMDNEVIPLEELEEENEEDDDGYKELKVEWERNHSYFKPSGTIIEQYNDGSFKHYKMDHASEAFNMWTLKTTNKDGKPDSFLSKWRSDPDRRIIDKMVMKLPEECNDNELSMFSGFYYKRIEIEVDEETRQRYIALFQELIKNMIGNDDEIYDALLKNFARLIQKPFQRPDICIIMSSKEHGVGKETILKIVKKIIGKHVAHYISDESFWDKHDTKKEGAILIHLEEAGASNKKMADALKARITSDIMSIRPCGINPYDIENVALYVFSTNKPLPIKLEESDRRFFIILCKGRNFNSNKEKLEYWSKVYKIIETDEFIKVIGDYLESIDIAGFNPRDFPVTEYKKSLMAESKSSEVLFLEQWEHDDDGDDKDVFYNKYKAFCIKYSLPYKQNSNSLGQAIAREDSYFIKHQDPETRRIFYTKK